MIALVLSALRAAGIALALTLAFALCGIVAEMRQDLGRQIKRRR